MAASTVAVCGMSAGRELVRGVFTLALGGAGLGGWLMALFPLWAIALGAATLAYHLRRRGEGAHERSAMRKAS